MTAGEPIGERCENDPVSYTFHKGHGTENDFVLVPGDVEVTPARARALTDRRAGIGGDGVIRVDRDVAGRWFMDYRNSDGSLSEMCGNGVRVFARYLAETQGAEFPLEIATRDGIKTITREGDEFTVDMGVPGILGSTVVGVPGHTWSATRVDMGNPHAVAFVEDLDQVGDLLAEPQYDDQVYPAGVNVEFVVRRGAGHVAMRVHERGSGETRSCGTGACAVAVATALSDGVQRPATYTVDVPGGRLRITWTAEGRILLTGPAVLVAEGTTDL